MADQVQFELVTPQKLLVSQLVDMVVVPGTEGNFGVLPGHAPLISTIRPGTIDIYQDRTTIVQRIFVASGFAEVTPEGCTVLADEAMPPESLDRAALETEAQTIEGNLPTLREQLGHTTGPDRERLATELRQLERQQAIARAKLQVLAVLSR
jgi:F-type H+-transporting ATPase subunit epsilon